MAASVGGSEVNDEYLPSLNAIFIFLAHRPHFVAVVGSVLSSLGGTLGQFWKSFAQFGSVLGPKNCPETLVFIYWVLRRPR